MNETKNIHMLLQDIEAAYQVLVDENTELRRNMVDLKVESETTIANLKNELESVKEDRAQITRTLQDTQGRLDRYHPEMQTLHDQLEQAEVAMNTLTMEVSQKNEQIKQLEGRIENLTRQNEMSELTQRTL